MVDGVGVAITIDITARRSPARKEIQEIFRVDLAVAVEVRRARARHRDRCWRACQLDVGCHLSDAQVYDVVARSIEDQPIGLVQEVVVVAVKSVRALPQ